MTDNPYLKYILIAIIIILVIIIFVLWNLLSQVPTAISLDSGKYPINSHASITVLDPSANTDPNLKEKITIRIQSGSDPGFSVELNENSKNSNIFFNPIYIAFHEPAFIAAHSSSNVPPFALGVNIGDIVTATYKGMSVKAVIIDPNTITTVGAFATTPLSNPHTAGGNFPTVGNPIDLDLAINCPYDDYDEDGLCDEWEQGTGLTITLPTTGMTYNLPCGLDPAIPTDPNTGLPIDCPSPYKKDIFVEIDYMENVAVGINESHRPMQAAIDRVVAKFAAAPITAPTGISGINLHVYVDETGIVNNDGDTFRQTNGCNVSVPNTGLVHVDELAVPGDVPPGGVPPINSFLGLKQLNFGTCSDIFNAQQWGTPIGDWLTAKRQAFHYAMFIHNQEIRTTSSGYAEIVGNDVVISLGSFANNGAGTQEEQEGTFMHELGHNLGLHHGGALPPDVNVDGQIDATDDTADNCKPNYFSVMSYSRQFPFYIVPHDTLDYSNSTLRTLIENNLVGGLVDENGALITIENITAYGVDDLTDTDPQERVVNVGPNAAGSIDWGGLPTNVNDLGASGCDSDTVSDLTGHDDWSNLQFTFRGSAYFSSGISTNPDALNEITKEALEQLLLNKHGPGIHTVYNSTSPVFPYGMHTISP